MTACPDENQLALLAEAALAEADRVVIERHLDGCASCSRLVGELATLAEPDRAYPERYRLIRQLGAGAMGVVWEAEDTQLGRKVALKWLTRDPSGDAAGDRERRGRLYREARALAQLRHPNVLAVHDAGEVGDQLFLALELVVGTTARAWLAAAPRTANETVALWRAVGAGLAAVHRAGIVHRDVKPDNVLVADDGRVLLGDFGLATAAIGDATELTQTGQVVGTPLYMAPEQLHGEPATAKSDQFALCVCLWEALAKTRPFPGSTFGALAVAMLETPKPPPGGDRDRFATLARGLAHEPGDRWPDVAALVAALAAAPRRRGRLVIAGGLAAVALAGTGTWWALHDRDSADRGDSASVDRGPDSRGNAGATDSRGNAGATDSHGNGTIDLARDSRGSADATDSRGNAPADRVADFRGNAGATDSRGNAGATDSRATDSRGNARATDSRGNTGATDSRGNAGATDSHGNAPADRVADFRGNAGATDSRGNAGATDSRGNAGATDSRGNGTVDSHGNAGATGSRDLARDSRGSAGATDSRGNRPVDLARDPRGNAGATDSRARDSRGNAGATESRRTAPSTDADRTPGASDRRVATDRTAPGDPRTAPTADPRGSAAGRDASGSGGRGDISATPVPPPPPPGGTYRKSPWRQHFDRAIDLTGAGDGAGCLAELAQIQGAPASFADDIAFMYPTCAMISGDCAGGRAELERLGRAHGWDAKRIALVIDTDDTMSCPLAAPPATQWPKRAWVRLQVAVSRHASCTPLLAFIEAHHLVMPEPDKLDLLRVSCMVDAGDCAGARAKHRAVVGGNAPVGNAEFDARLDQAFDRTYPRCKP